MENPMARKNKQTNHTNQNKNPKPNTHTPGKKGHFLDADIFLGETSKILFLIPQSKKLWECLHQLFYKEL